MSDPSALLNAINAVLSPLFRANRSSRALPGVGGAAASASSLDRALGAAATVGLGIVFFRWVAQALQRSRDHGTKEMGKKQSSGTGGATGIPTFLYPFVQILIKGLLSSHDEEERPGNKEEEEADDGVLIRYNGSCHCRSIHFELRAPRVICVNDFPCGGKGKIQYPHLQTVADNFNLTEGTEFLQIYYITLPSSKSELDQPKVKLRDITAAHAFCKRCGVHILRAPDSSSDVLEINSNCLDGDETWERMRRLKVEIGGSSLGSGVPIEGQWDGEGAVHDRGDEGTTHFAKGFDIGSTNLFDSDFIRGPLHNADPPVPAVLETLEQPSISITATVSKHREIQSMSPYGNPGTPATSATSGASDTSLPSSLLPSGRSHTSDQEISTVEASIDGSDAQSSSSVSGESSSSLTPATNSAGIGSWAVGPSLRQRSIQPQQHPTPARASTAVNPSPSSSVTHVNRDQLKYYMRRHLNKGNPAPYSC